MGTGKFAALVRRPLGRALALNRSTIDKLEDGQPPSVLQLYGISKALELPLEDLALSVVKELGVSLLKVGALPNVMVTSVEAKRIALAYDRADRETKVVIARLLSEQVKEITAGGKGAPI